MKLKVFIVIVTVLILLLVSPACEKNSETSTTSDVPTFTGEGTELIPLGELKQYCLDATPGTPGAANDDIVTPPGGLAYRAKVHEVGKPDWPPVEEVEKTTTALGGTIRCQYREYIETKAGETRNNILYLFGDDAPGLTDPLNVAYFVEGLPDGISIILGSHWYGGAAGHNIQSSKVIFRIDVASPVQTGKYIFNIILMYEGEEIATLPCTVSVIK